MYYSWQELPQTQGNSSKCLRERSNISVPAGATHVYRNAVPIQKYLWERRSHAFTRDYTPAYRNGAITIMVLSALAYFCPNSD